jgi:general secretion pathway protein A
MTFGLPKNPFSMTPDPAFLFLTEQHRESLVGLTYAILERKGFAVLTGEVGTGKTTLLARVLQFLPPTRLQFSLILNPTLTPSEFLEMALLDFGMRDIPSSKAQRLWKLQNLLLQGQSEGKVSALIVDEAHKLSPEVLEEIRLLGNYEEADQKLLQILLVGQPELDDILNREDLRQLKQRVAVRLSIKPLAPPEVGQYIRHRWLRAGGTHPPFSANAIADIADISRGIPRLINSVCENALTLAFAEGSHSLVEPRHVQEAAADLRLIQRAVPLPKIAEEDHSVPEPAVHPSETVSMWTQWIDKVSPRRTPAITPLLGESKKH